jgi:hypothetical protein
MASISGSVTIAGDPDDWIACAFDAATHAFAGVAAVSAGSYTISGLTAGKAYVVSCRPKTGPAWTATTTQAEGDLVIPTDPMTTPYIFEAAPGAGYDPTVGLLMHFNGANNSTTFTEETGKTVTRTSPTVISTAQSKFGGASLFVNGGKLSIANDADFVFGSGGFTIECFFYNTAGSFQQYLICRDNQSFPIFDLYLLSDKLRGFAKNASSGDISLVGTTTVTQNAWHHAAFVRNGNNFRLYLDGNLEGSASSSMTLYESASQPLTIGALSNGSYPFNGYIDEARIKSSGSYASSCTPPTAEFSFSNTGSTEPTWPTTPGNTVADGDITWTNMGQLVQPLMQGPLIAA